jgi:hypothetical protein
MEALERKIEKAQEQVSKTKKQYDAALAALSDLLDKRDAIRRDELVNAIMKSNRTYEEVISFLGDGLEEDECERQKDQWCDPVLFSKQHTKRCWLRYGSGIIIKENTGEMRIQSGSSGSDCSDIQLSLFTGK